VLLLTLSLLSSPTFNNAAEVCIVKVLQVEKVLGTSKVGPKYRITLVKAVQEKLKVDIGDLIVFVEDERGNIYLKVSKMT
jgi:hypothetical protein